MTSAPWKPTIVAGSAQLRLPMGGDGRLAGWENVLTAEGYYRRRRGLYGDALPEGPVAETLVPAEVRAELDARTTPGWHYGRRIVEGYAWLRRVSAAGDDP